MANTNGGSLIEGLVALALVGLGMAVALPNLISFRGKTSLELLARHLVSDAVRCRAAAINRRCNVGLMFGEERGAYYYNVVADGNGNGVSRRDVQRRRDTVIGPRVWIDRLCRGAKLGVPSGWRVPDPGGSGRLRPGDGLHAGRSAILSFSPLGDATPASVYLNDGRERMLAVRVYGGTARVRVLEWRRGWQGWRRVSV
jgi:type II secretory pathway pseudopilin PulG